MASTKPRQMSLLSCDKCHAKFDDGRTLDVHLRQVHNDVRPFLCHLCPGRFASPNELEEHVDACRGKSGKDIAAESVVSTESCSSGVASSSITATSLANAITLPVRGANVPNILKKIKSGTVVSHEVLQQLLGKANHQPTLRRGTVGEILERRRASEVVTAGPSAAVIRLPAAGLMSALPAGAQVRVVAMTAGQTVLPANQGLNSSMLKPLASTSTITTLGTNANTNNTTNCTTKAITIATSHPDSSIGSSSDTIKVPTNDTIKREIKREVSTAPPIPSSSNAEGPLEPFRCKASNCLETFVSVADLSSHVTDQHPTELYNVCCVLCDMAFSGTTELEEHVRSFVCPIDSNGKWKGYGSMPSLPSGSLNIFDPSISTKLELPDLLNLPGLKFDGPETMAESDDQLMDEKPDPSTFLLSDTDSLESEPDDPVTRADQKRQQRRHQCNVCHKEYTTLHAFTKHYKKHANTRVMAPQGAQSSAKKEANRYPCNVCNKSFDHFSKLFNHRKIHTGETPYSCKYCDMAYVDISGLQYHMYGSHAWALTNLKLIHCRVLKETVLGSRPCPGKFFNVKNLREHFLIVHQHESPANFKCFCDICHRTFLGADGMEQHIQSNECKITSKISEWLSHSEIRPDLDSKFSSGEDSKAKGVQVRNSLQTQGKKRKLHVVVDRVTKCPRCRKEFRDLSLLETHYNTRCNIAARVDHREWRGSSYSKCFFCETCSLRFVDEHHYRKHLVLHAKSGEVVKSLENSDATKVEEDDCGNASDQTRMCSLCPEVFHDVVSFFEHYKTHGNPKQTRTYRRKQARLATVDDAPVPEDTAKTSAEAKTSDAAKTSAAAKTTAAAKTSCTAKTSVTAKTSGTAKTSTQENGDVLSEKDANSSQAPVVKKPKLIWHASEKTDAPSRPLQGRSFKFQKSCSICHRIFSDMDTFIEHYRLHNKNDTRLRNSNNGAYCCHECGSTFISRQVYLNHMKIHTGETPFKCKFCNEACATEVDLGLHIPAAHMKQKFFKIIERGSAHRAEKHHVVTSVYELEFSLGLNKHGQKRKNWHGKCLECDKLFNTYKEMKIHVLSEECAVTFRPLVINTSEGCLQRYLCKICGNLYEEARGLKAHLIKSHTKIPHDS